jgi:hypothetical protein
VVCGWEEVDWISVSKSDFGEGTMGQGWTQYASTRLQHGSFFFSLTGGGMTCNLGKKLRAQNRRTNKKPYFLYY